MRHQVARRWKSQKPFGETRGIRVWKKVRRVQCRQARRRRGVYKVYDEDCSTVKKWITGCKICGGGAVFQDRNRDVMNFPSHLNFTQEKVHWGVDALLEAGGVNRVLTRLQPPSGEIPVTWLQCCINHSLINCESTYVTDVDRQTLAGLKLFISTKQNRLRRDLEAAQFRHRAEEGRDGHRAEEHPRADGFQSSHQPGHGENREPAGGVQPHRVLWVHRLVFVFQAWPRQSPHVSENSA